MRGDGLSCFPCSPLRVPYLWAFIGSSFVFYKLLLLIKKKKKKCSAASKLYFNHLLVLQVFLSSVTIELGLDVFPVILF